MISLVVVARNDNYGGSFLARLQMFLDALALKQQAFGLDLELVVVEWNPPAGRRPLANVVRWPSAVRTRIATVPHEVHARLVNADRMDVFEYIAKNVGIRRARGEFVLATNPDVVLGNRLCEYLAREEDLPLDAFCRNDRIDVDDEIPACSSANELDLYCELHACKVNSLGNDFGPLAYRRAREDGAIPFGRRTIERPEELHLNASGDFFLMARRHWHALRGYPELPTNRFIDGYVCYTAAAAGLAQVYLDCPVYHQEHSRVANSTRPVTDYAKMLEDGQTMLTSRSPWVPNAEDWGHADCHLPEVEPGRPVGSGELS